MAKLPITVGLTPLGVISFDKDPQWVGPVCPKCRQWINLVLDMTSFAKAEDGRLELAHAHCVWFREAFAREAELAPENKS